MANPHFVHISPDSCLTADVLWQSQEEAINLSKFWSHRSSRLRRPEALAPKS